MGNYFQFVSVQVTDAYSWGPEVEMYSGHGPLHETYHSLTNVRQKMN